jgi:hypothetical protein
MPETLASPYIEMRNRGYYLTGSRISLDSIAYAVRRNETVDEILEDFPAISSQRNLEGAVAFVKSHPDEVGAYLEENARLWEEARKLNPPELVEKMRIFRENEAGKLKSA